ncbi:phosphatase PAP2 family protein [Oscillatoria salina]|uniref:phosphatase PAP2 family protein n=1 Tax=Oscillatoria salina TaxID=331517 RepID=UPI001CCE78EF|nr:phosphatase PAP2 family protein [Oscillatoria salina]
MRENLKKFIFSLPKWVREHLLPLLLTIRVGGLILAGFALWSFAEIAEEILERESYFFDKQILLAIAQWHNPLADRIVVGLTYLGQPTFLLIVCTVLGIGLLFNRKRSEATTLAIAAFGAAGLNLLLKDLFARDRPQLWDRIVDVNFYSFPSGHAMISMVIYGAIAYLLAINFPKWRVAIVVTAVFLILSIGFTRLYLGVHWPTDVIAGYAAGIVWLVTCILSLELFKARREVDRD